MPRISKENYYLDIAETVLERATCGGSTVPSSSRTMRSFPPATTARPRTEKLRRPRLLHTRLRAGPARRALRALPQRPRRGERHHLGLPARHGRRHHLSCGPRRAHGRAAARRDELCHVPPPDHQRGARKGRHPPHGDGVRGRARAAVDRRGRFSSRSIRHKKRRSLFKRPSFFCSAFSGSISRCRRSGT